MCIRDRSVNERTENIGARRLYTVMERLLEDVSFSAGSADEEMISINAEYVDGRLNELAKNCLLYTSRCV